MHAITGSDAEHDRVHDARRVRGDDGRLHGLEWKSGRGSPELRRLLRGDELLGELDVVERQAVDLSAQAFVVAAQRLDLGDGLPRAADRGADLAEDALDRDQELGRERRLAPHDRGVARQEEQETRREKGDEWPSEGRRGTGGAPRATEAGHSRLFNAARARLSLVLPG